MSGVSTGEGTNTGPTRADQMPFLVQDENSQAWALAGQAVCERSQTDRGQLILIHGRAGTGKTLLCEQVVKTSRAAGCFQAVEIRDETRAELTPAGDGESAPVLIIEDVHQLSGRPSSQRRLAWMIDDQLRAGTTIVLTSLYSAGELRGFEERLTSRLLGAAAAGIRLPGAESRNELLRHYCLHLGISSRPDALRLIARRLAVSPRVLLGTLLRFDEMACVRQQVRDVSLAREFLRLELRDESVKSERVIREVAREFGVTVGDLKSAARDQALQLPRQCAIYLLRELTDESLVQIGSHFGNRSHSTVLHAINRVSGSLSDDAALRQRLNTIRRVLHAD